MIGKHQDFYSYFVITICFENNMSIPTTAVKRALAAIENISSMSMLLRAIICSLKCKTEIAKTNATQSNIRTIVEEFDKINGLLDMWDLENQRRNELYREQLAVLYAAIGEVRQALS